MTSLDGIHSPLRLSYHSPLPREDAQYSVSYSAVYLTVQYILRCSISYGAAYLTVQHIIQCSISYSLLTTHLIVLLNCSAIDVVQTIFLEYTPLFIH